MNKSAPLRHSEEISSKTLDELKKSVNVGLHWVHWMVILASLGLTFFAWYFTKKQVDEKNRDRFDREASQVQELIVERLKKYEDFLWAGVGFVRSMDSEMDYLTWLKYSQTMNIDKKYPGINGIGIIEPVKLEEKEAYLRKQRKYRPDFKIFPTHQYEEFWPISFVEPYVSNQKAVGLDMAHETNRFTAAKKARDYGTAQITGPITLVQDASKTPGFLFYVPYYKGVQPATTEERVRSFRGLVYAPFVFKKLMDGALSKHNRHVGIKISDGKDVLFDEHDTGEVYYDPNPLYKSVVKVNLYGRTWIFDIRSAQSFRKAHSSNQPFTILAGGIFIDSLLLLLFVVLSRSNKRALYYSEKVTQELEVYRNNLVRANEELTQFNYRTSHDLVAPLKTISGFVNLLKEELKDNDVESAMLLLPKIDGQAKKLSTLVNELLELSRADYLNEEKTNVNIEEMIGDIKASLNQIIQENKVEVVLKLEGVEEGVCTQKTRFRQVLENLISNSVKYADLQKSNPFVEVNFKRVDSTLQITIQDNGLGISKENQANVFEMFYRGHSDVAFGSGLGAYLVKKHVQAMDGTIELESEKKRGTIIKIKLPVH